LSEAGLERLIDRLKLVRAQATDLRLTHDL
jgi:hypothetical protein